MNIELRCGGKWKLSDVVFSPIRLKEAMNGMSNLDLAAKLGCARSNISMYLAGTRTPTKMTIQLMAICLGVNPAWLMGLDVPKYVEGTQTTSTELAKDEQQLLQDYRSLSDQGQEYIRQTMVMAVHTYKKDDDLSDMEEIG